MTAFHTQSATDEFARRRNALTRAFREGRLSETDANANARLWLAIAAAAGADLAELEVDRIFPPGTKGRMNADQVAPREDWRAELTRARDVAVRRAMSNLSDLKAQQRAWDIQSLAIALGCDPTTALKQQSDSANKDALKQQSDSANKGALDVQEKEAA